MAIPTLALGAAASVVWAILLVVYRLYVSPLSKFPGSKLAISTECYEFYHQVIRGGQYPWVIQKMHEEYGPIIRINPHELHVNDPAFYDEIYNYKQLDKYGPHTRQFGHPNSSSNTVEHDLHKSRTSSIAPYFTRGNILHLEQEVIGETLRKLCKRIDEFRGTGKPMPIGVAYRAFTTDVISKYTMATSFGFLDEPDFKETWFNEFLENVGMVVEKTVEKASRAGVGTKSNSIPTVFYEMAHNEKVPAEERSLDRLTDEGVLFIVAGNETTGNALSNMTFHILNTPRILQSLKAELSAAIPNSETIPQWRDLEHLPYLSAVIKEGLRMSYGVVSRMPRVSPNTEIRYKDWVIPPNTAVSMNNMDMHDDPSVFVNPKSFDPERWLQPESIELQKQLAPFCRGTRACVGMNLAYAEMYIALATIFRRYNMELYETSRVDVDVAHEFHIPQVKKGSKGVRMLVK
ncbi:hypothetical protein HO133_009448 [Letharia lupina]|uniref:Cytochrome P450 n=1 Tax=Letharia lupina TaxID=560253 RepID=A0A8H6CL03_9LECA|nr:uncharacterized protein HO133_009448 [Letharia lupina]KAF6225448.1 hypothetical protein HO133_009448 [Letharia lupina]